MMYDSYEQTPDMSTKWCPDCEPDRDPILEILEVHRCALHQVNYTGSQDQEIRSGIQCSGTMESGGEDNTKWCNFIHRDNKIKPITVCIPSRTSTYAYNIIRSLRPWNSDYVKIIIADNGLTHPLPEDVYSVKQEDPFIFSSAINKCAALRLPGSDLFILNDDAVVQTKHWAEKLRMLLDIEATKQFGIISPRVIGAVGNNDQRWAPPEQSVWITKNPICFLAACIRSEVWESVGQLDERFNAYGCDDVDLCRRTVEAGWLLGVTGDIVVQHGLNGMGGSTYQRMLGSNWPEEGQRAIKIFREKWGTGPQLGDYS